MKKILLTSTQFSGEITLTYNEDNILIEHLNRADLTPPQRKFFNDNFPFTYEALLKLKQMRPDTLSIKDYPEDLSFENFWNKYDHKGPGDKKKANTAWLNLRNEEKALALLYIPKYFNFIKSRTPNPAKLYATTYLNQKRWEN